MGSNPTDIHYGDTETEFHGESARDFSLENKPTSLYVNRFMGRWESLVDQKIREAMEQGEFDNLAGKGEPIDLSENPYEDPDWRTAHRLLRHAGFAPAWIEERKDIEAELEAARKQLSRVWSVMRNARGAENEKGAKARWENAVSAFSQQANDLNKQIVVWNLKVPSAALHRKLIDAEREIERIREAV